MPQIKKYVKHVVSPLQLFSSKIQIRDSSPHSYQLRLWRPRYPCRIVAAHWDANEVVGEAKAASQMAPSVNMYELEYTVAGPESMETRKVLPCRPHLWTSERELTEEELAQQAEQQSKSAEKGVGALVHGFSNGHVAVR